jgi:modulator of FtsH protease
MAFGARTYESSSRVVATHRVLRNTYMLLGLSLIPTALGAFIGMNMNFSFMVGSPIISTLLMIAVMFGMLWAVQANRDSGLGVVLLLAFTGVMGLFLGPILQVAAGLSNGGQIVTLAAGGTAAIFLTLAGIATTSKRDFSFLGKFLMIGLVMLILASLANLFFQIPALALTLSGVAVLLFSGLLLFDISRIVNGGETNYVMATLAVYLDLYNIFVNLLQLLMAFMGERD